MDTKHLDRDSECPPTTPGLIRVYCMRYCPFGMRTLLILENKNLKYEVVNLNLISKPLWYVDKNPIEMVSSLELDGKIVIESVHTSNLLDELYPSDPPLYSEDIWQRYQEKGLIEVFGTKVIQYFTALCYSFLPDEVFEEKYIKLKEGVRYFETLLMKNGTAFFRGDIPGMIDYFMWPWFERFSPFEKIVKRSFFTEEECPYLTKYVQMMLEDDAVKKVLVSDDRHIKYITAARSGKKIYDF